MTAGTARTARRPRTWAISGWAGTARPITARAPAPPRGRVDGRITPCTPGPTRPPRPSPRASAPRRPALCGAGHTDTGSARAGTRVGGGGEAPRRGGGPPPAPATLRARAPWSRATSLPRPGGPRQDSSPHPPADLAEIVRIYGIRHWTGQSYKQVKDQLGWADFQVRSDTAIRRHQALVNCAFSFCWDAWFHDHHAPHQTAAPQPAPGGGEGGAARRRPTAGAVLAAGAARRTRLAFPLDRAAALVAGMVQGAPAPAAASPDQLGRGRLRPAPLHP